MANPSKRKGSHFELEVCKKFAEHGLLATKMPFSGALNLWKGDVEVPVRGETKKLECKRRARAFGTIYSYLGNNYGLVVRDDRTEPLVILRLEDFAKLARLT